MSIIPEKEKKEGILFLHLSKGLLYLFLLNELSFSPPADCHCCVCREESISADAIDPSGGG